MIFITALSVLFPLFAKILFGFILRQIRILTERSLRELNSLVFKILLPILLFSNLYKTDFSTITSFRLLGFSVLIILAMFGSYMLIIPRIVKENPKRGVLVQGISRSNFIFFGMPMAAQLFGGTSAGIASLMVGVVVPLLNMTSVIALEFFRGNRPNYLKIISGIVKNPIIIGGALGLLFTTTGMRLPSLLADFIFEIASIATPIALIVLGGSVTFTSVRSNTRALVIGVLNRLVIVPSVGITIAILAGFHGLELVLLMSMLASPSAVSSFAMAQQMDGDADLAGQMVVFTTVFSLFTLFFWISLLMALNLF